MILDIITKKKNNQELTKEEINYVITNYLNETIKDYQMSAFLMAVVIHGMTIDETIYLTEAMIKSGNVLDLSSINGTVVDKHSTGGIGDKTTLLIAPIIASCGVKMAKMSGRGLGHTGGTIDKLEAIPNFNVNIPEEEFINQINNINVAITSAMKELVPADKKIYALRDVTATVESIPLIASSIMSKKIASGASSIVIDVKVGNGALIKTIAEAQQLAHLLIQIGKKYDRKVICVLTDMNQPLGTNIGNALEVLECLDFLNNKYEEDLYNVVIELSTNLIMLAKNINYEQALEQVKDSLQSKEALNKFYELIEYQNGDISKLQISDYTVEVISSKTGYIKEIDSYQFGMLAKEMGAGRETKEDIIDYKVGIKFTKKIGDYIEKGEVIAILYLGNKNVNENINQAIIVSDEPVSKINPIIEVIK